MEIVRPIMGGYFWVNEGVMPVGGITWFESRPASRCAISMAKHPLGEDIGAVDFHGAHSDVQFLCNHLAQFSCQYPVITERPRGGNLGSLEYLYRALFLTEDLPDFT
ncbi:hypothetical protein [Parachitinimonas caeni]|uniref:Uncharacterized protein n=1 Tax=Parachitinimonas caeni TaxID=3031301 RepID=A0ABT7DTM7_9NEIS|nr:hypothetical protein [Parachitinimonas caeni]MDK2122500.1 hypothetical protein [Parachitinimonas caeni]